MDSTSHSTDAEGRPALPTPLGAAAAGHPPGEGRPLRVAYLVYSFHVGGLERCVARLVNGLDPRWFTPSVIALDGIGDARSWIERGDATITSLGRGRGNDPRLVWRLARCLRQQQIDILHSHNWGTLLEATLARRLARVPVHVHAERGTVLSDLEHRGWKMQLRGRLMRWALGRADAVVAVAEAVRQKVALHAGFPAERVRVIENGVDRPPVSRAEVARKHLRDELGLGPQTYLVGSVGRLVDVKDFPLAIAALAQVVASGIDLHLVLVGAGPLRAELEAASRAAGVAERLHLVGHQSNVGAWLAAMDLYLNCSKSEGQSQSVLEAMAAGLPSVVTDVGDSARLVGGPDACGLVVPAGQPGALAQALAGLCNSLDLRNQCGRNALDRHAQRYSVRRMLAVYERLYTELASQRLPGTVGADSTGRAGELSATGVRGTSAR